MPQDISQQPKDKSAAALSFATMLSENLLRQRNPQQEQSAEVPMEVEPEESPKTQEKPEPTDSEGNDKDAEIEELKQEIRKVLDENDEENGNDEKTG